VALREWHSKNKTNKAVYYEYYYKTISPRKGVVVKRRPHLLEVVKKGGGVSKDAIR